ncbi:MAG: FAD-dependent oxidoreductase, partial [Caulobacteraceae bacterium]|nr:FAD-dependent oxidoreductase [Caulobacteraceae bacterium]
RPIKGHILRLPGLVLSGPVVRGAGGYVCPDPGGALVGATMEPGVDDPVVDPGHASGLLAFARRLGPALADRPRVLAAGIRGATSDGLPLVGPSRTQGVFVAAGVRRNGWLLAPLVADAITDQLLGNDRGPLARAFDPARDLA